MASLSKAEGHHRARIAALSRDREPNDPELAEARESYRCAKRSARIRQLVEDAPDLPREDLEFIASALGMRVVEKGCGHGTD